MAQKKKWMALLLAAAMIVTIFVGCGNGDTASEAVAESVSAPVEETSIAEPETAPVSVEEPVAVEEASSLEETSELEPATVEMEEKTMEMTFVNETMEMPITEDDITLTYWTQFMPPLLDYGYNSNADFPIFQYLEELTGVHIDFTCVNMGSASEQASVLMASGDYPDIWNSFYNYYSGSAAQAIDDEIAIDLAEYKDELENYFGIIDAHEELANYAYTDEGQVAYLYCMYRTPDAKNGSAIRGDWLDALGLDVPVTYDEYYDVLSALNTEYGATYYMTSTAEGVFAPGFGLKIDMSNDTNFDMFLLDENDQVYYSAITENYREYLTYMNKLWNDGLIYSDFVTNTAGGVEYGDVVNGDYSLLGFTVTFYGSLESLLDEGDPLYLQGVSPAVQNEGDILHVGEAPTYITGSGAKILTTALLGDEAKLDAALKWVDYWFTEEGSDLCCYGQEGVSYTIENGERQFTDVVLNNPDGMAFTLAMQVYAMGNGTFLADPTVNTISYSENQMNLYESYIDTLVNASDYSYQIPSYLSLGTTESESYAKTYSDIITYVAESYLKFITGTLNLEGDFDAYCAEVQSMGIDSCVKIIQDAYDNMN
jgi:putative aldouronate transport system substrate-binding protein